jgi:hypothetical protein
VGERVGVRGHATLNFLMCSALTLALPRNQGFCPISRAQAGGESYISFSQRERER